MVKGKNPAWSSGQGRAVFRWSKILTPVAALDTAPMGVTPPPPPPPLDLEMTRDDKGHVVNASCDCPPGDKVDDTCKHISALCYTLEEHSKIDEMYQMSDYYSMTRLEGCICPHQCHLLQVEESESTEFELEEEYEQSMVYDPQLLATAGAYFSHPPPSKLKTR